MRSLDLFSGIGGMALGLERAGLTTAGLCEIDAACRFWLAEHWPGVPIWSDIRELTGEVVRERVGAIDLLAGGFPCQDISVAGKGEGIEGARSGLWSEMFRLVREVRPRWVLAENVPALRTRGADRVLGDLEGEGYSCWPLVVGADDVGAPHRRKRVWIVAHTGARGRASGEPCAHAREPNPARRDALAHGQRDTLREQPGRSGGTNGSGEAEFGGRSAGAVADGESRGLRVGGRTCDPGNGRDPHGGGATLVHSYGHGLALERSGWVLHGERAPSGHDADGRGEWPVGSPTGPGLAGRRGCPKRPSTEEPVSAGAGPHVWPSRPGEPQQAWEAPRLLESGFCGATDGLPEGVAPYLPAHRRAALRALGNAVVPQVAEALGRAILRADS